MGERACFIVVCAVVALWGAVASANVARCSNIDFRNFGLNSPYSASDADTSASLIQVPGCEAINAFHLARHGTRWGSPTDHSLILSLRGLQKRVLANQKKGKVNLCPKDTKRILEWTTSVDHEKAYDLMFQGKKDHQSLGERFKQRLPYLQKVSRGDIKLYHGMASRTKLSAESFGNGLFGKNVESDGYNTLSDFFGVCPKFGAQYLSFKLSGEYKKFQSSADMKKVIDRVSHRLGFKESLKFDDIQAIFTSCGYETAWNVSRAGHDRPAWCAAFEQQDFEVLEYWSDLKEDLRTGYLSKELHQSLGCKPVRELFAYFKSIVDAGGKSEEKAQFYFTHDTLINQVITFLGLYMDTPPLAGDAVRANRAWRVTKFSPFASNIGGVLFKCNGSKTPQYKVQMFLNERPLPMSFCGGSVCTWERFTTQFGKLWETCNTVEACTGVKKTVRKGLKKLKVLGRKVKNFFAL